MKSGTAKKVAGAIFLILFSVMMLLFIAVLWGLIKAPCADSFFKFITGEKVFLRVIIGIGVLGLLAFEAYVFIFAGIRNRQKSKSPMNLLGRNAAGNAYISSAAIDAMVCQCVKKRPEVKDSACVIAPCEEGGITIELKLKTYRDSNLPMICAALQQEVKNYIEQHAGIPVRSITVSVVDVADNSAAAPSEKRVK